MWLYVRERFRRFGTDLQITDNQRDDGLTKFANVSRALQNAYYANAAGNIPALIVGSWGKQTQVRPSHDLDMFMILPWEVKARFDQRAGNVQSQLLQEMRGELAGKYPQTNIRGDGQVVAVQFNTILVEVVPSFMTNAGQFLIPDTNEGGRWKTVDPIAQIMKIEQADTAYSGNARKLARMAKRWKHEHDVDIKSFVIELIVSEFLGQNAYSHHDEFWFDWIVRDFFGYLVSQANGYLFIPGTNEIYMLGSTWLTAAQRAQVHALKACEYERDDSGVLAGLEWQEIFGNRIPAIL